MAATVVVPAYNAAATIGRTLHALAGQVLDGEFEIIVVDSGSSDETLDVVDAAALPVRVLRNRAGEPSSSRNLGALHASSSVLAFTDADCEPEPDWLAAGLRRLASAEIVQGMVLPREWHGPFDRTLSVGSEYGLYETANLFVRREMFDRVGGFEPIPGLDLRFDSPFGEDVWFVWRAKRLGARTVFAEDALVRHAVFRRRVREHLREMWRRRYFPGLVRLVPELRSCFLHRGWFLTPASARFDAALLGVLTATLMRDARPLLLAAPSAIDRLGELRRHPADQRWRILAGRLGEDAITLAALIDGSLRARTLVL